MTSQHQDPYRRPRPDGNDEGMTHTPSPSIAQAQRRCRRFMGSALTSGPLLVAGVVWASPAQADAASYLNDTHHVQIVDFDGGDAALLTVGQKLCVHIWYGHPPDELAAAVLQNSDTARGADGLTPQQADELVYYAKADLCPNY